MFNPSSRFLKALRWIIPTASTAAFSVALCTHKSLYPRYLDLYSIEYLLLLITTGITIAYLWFISLNAKAFACISTNLGTTRISLLALAALGILSTPLVRFARTTIFASCSNPTVGCPCPDACEIPETGGLSPVFDLYHCCSCDQR